MFLKSKWVCVNDKMPEKDRSVLVTDGKRIRVAKLMRDDKGVYTTVGILCNSYQFGIPTHWMRLPRLPNEKK